MKYKVNDWIIFKDKNYSAEWESYTKISLYNKVGKIIKKDDTTYLVQFQDYVDPNFPRNSKYGHYLWVENDEIELYIDHLKLKKLIEHGV